MSYYNTTNLRAQSLADAIYKAKSQQQAVYFFLRKHKNKSFTRSELAENLKNYKLKIERHSIGRCLTNLLNEGKVEKLNITRVSYFGVGTPEHPYKFKL